LGPDKRTTGMPRVPGPAGSEDAVGMRGLTTRV
jgi:hypothetical protein